MRRLGTCIRVSPSELGPEGRFHILRRIVQVSTLQGFCVDELDIHNAKRNLKRILVRVKSSHMSEKNKNLIMGFYDDCVLSSLSTNRILFYIYKLFKIVSLFGKDLSNATKEDIKDIVRKVELNENYTEWTKNNYKVTLRKFYHWLEGYPEDYPEKVRWIKTGVKKDRTKVINVVSEDDVKRLIECVDSVTGSL